MKVHVWGRKDEMDSHEGPGFMVEVSPKEALNIIQSLTFQMMNNSSNNGRAEMYTENNEYFSIAVYDNNQKGIPPEEGEVGFIYDKIEWQAKHGRELSHHLKEKK